LGTIENIRGLLRKLRPVSIHTLVYGSPSPLAVNPDLEVRSTEDRRKSGIREIDRKAGWRRTAYYVTVDGRLAHVSWVFRRNLLARQLGFKEESVIGDCATFEPFKGRRLYGDTVNYIMKTHPDRKYILFVVPENAASIRGLERIGLVRKGLFTVRRFLGLAYKIIKHD
jgi:hypothetical protein